MVRQSRRVWVGSVLTWLAVSTTVNAQLSDRTDGMRFVPDVPGQWRALTERGEALGFHIGDTPDPSACRHYQAITRVDGPDGTPYFIVTRSGNTPEIPLCPDELCCNDSDGERRKGNLIVVRMGSRDKNGERLRSNRLRKGVHVNDTAPPPEDVATVYYSVTADGLVLGQGEGLVPRVYGHPGGMQLVGKMLAVAVEAPQAFPHECAPCFFLPDPPPQCDPCFNYEAAPDETLIMFFDVSDPEAPVFTSSYPPVRPAPDGSALEKAGIVAVTPLPNGLYLMAVTGGSDPSFLYFYRSNLNDLSSTALSWEPVGKAPYPSVENAHQTLQFIREGNIDGALYLAGARGHPDTIFNDDEDRIDLYRVECDSGNYEPGEEIRLTVRFNGRRITPRPSTGGDRMVNLAAATGYYISPSGELILYATEHDNDGPSGTVKAGEWRHIDMVRENSPTLLPSAKVNGPYEVDEGSRVDLTGSAAPSITRPWIQLFHETDFGGSDFSTFYPVVDFDDWGLDDFDDFFTLEFQQLSFDPPVFFRHNDQARSWKWFAPVGCSMLVHDQDGDNVRTLTGADMISNLCPTNACSDPDLSQVLNDPRTDDMDAKIDLVAFFLDCHQYYATPVELQWDLDGNGSFETTGSPVTFDAGSLDGPGQVSVPAQAQHPSGGPAGQAAAVVNVLNVPPAISLLQLEDSAGNVVGVDVPFVLLGLPATLVAEFADPGLPDHQTASLDWGDGTVEAQGAFTFFDEAFGDGAGSARHSHAYLASGSFGLEFSVTDDDHGGDSRSLSVEVVTPEEAVEQIVDLLEDAIAANTDPKAGKDLQKALKSLIGNPLGTNGALIKIQNEQDAAAIAFLNEAIHALQAAQVEGADVGTLIALLQQVVAALQAS